MKLLLDTHVLLWTLLDPKRLSPEVADALRDEGNRVLISVVSAWEIEIKLAKGKLPIPGTLEDALTEQGFEALPVTMPHALAVESLPDHHRDPFDRMLIAQARLDGATLVTADREIRRYPIAVLAAC